MDLSERVAVLEERTRVKPKSFLDHVKEWGGVCTLIVALLYTFPLGVWDRFYLTKKARESAEILELREVALQVAKLDGDWARSAGSIPTPDLQTMASRAYGAEKTTILSGKIGALRKYKDRLTAPELVMLGYSISQMNKPTLTEELYATAFEKAKANGNTGLSADILRLRAFALLNSVDGLNLEKMRGLYSQSAALLAPLEADNYVLQTAFNLFEWSQIELAKGDWICGEVLVDMAIQKLADLPPFSPMVVQYKQQFGTTMNQYSQRPNQPANGCPDEVLAELK
ncbi:MULTISPECIES: hypothetical protein [unclassified Roseovarius]|uniref:hypothetical protein n=1 Tax=unclassified Roseovarius TaxID=2614913 RepID=UPI00273D31A1|nr:MULTISPECIES: hypothetical protein [unclassified Roseovarius]